jgi:hypothetical protein
MIDEAVDEMSATEPIDTTRASADGSSDHLPPAIHLRSDSFALRTLGESGERQRDTAASLHPACQAGVVRADWRSGIAANIGRLICGKLHRHGALNPAFRPPGFSATTIPQRSRGGCYRPLRLLASHWNFRSLFYPLCHQSGPCFEDHCGLLRWMYRTIQSRKQPPVTPVPAHQFNRQSRLLPRNIDV